MKLKLLLAKLILLGCSAPCFAPVQEGRYVMVYPRKCIDEINLAGDSYLEFPLENGIPDEKHGRLMGERVIYNPNCPQAFYRKVE